MSIKEAEKKLAVYFAISNILLIIMNLIMWGVLKNIGMTEKIVFSSLSLILITAGWFLFIFEDKLNELDKGYKIEVEKNPSIKIQAFIGLIFSLIIVVSGLLIILKNIGWTIGCIITILGSLLVYWNLKILEKQF